MTVIGGARWERTLIGDYEPINISRQLAEHSRKDFKEPWKPPESVVESSNTWR